MGTLYVGKHHQPVTVSDETERLFRQLPDSVEFFWVSAEEAADPDTSFYNHEEGAPGGEGWYAWHCQPGCLPDSEPINFGPDLEGAVKAAWEWFTYYGMWLDSDEEDDA